MFQTPDECHLPPLNEDFKIEAKESMECQNSGVVQNSRFWVTKAAEI